MKLIIVCLSLALAVVQATDYCSTSVCSGGDHIACGNSNTWASSCPADAELLEIDDEMKQLLLNQHNEKRNYVAGGEEANLNAACRMATMQWDDELAALAELNVRQCEMKHDSCHNTDAFKYSGQNLAWMGYSGSVPALSTLLTKSVQMWYNEVDNTDSALIESGIPSGYSGPTVGHFTVMMNENNVRLGCASSKYLQDGWNAVLVACNYATTNFIGHQVYSSCSQGAQQCSTGANTQFSNLCSVDEQYSL